LFHITNKFLDSFQLFLIFSEKNRILEFVMANKYFIDEDRCTGCLACVENCPAGALRAEVREEWVKVLHNPIRCARCGLCWRNCPEGAISLEDLTEGRWLETARVKLLFCERCGAVLGGRKHAEVLPEGRRLCERCRRLAEGQRWAQWIRPKEVLR